MFIVGESYECVDVDLFVFCIVGKNYEYVDVGFFVFFGFFECVDVDLCVDRSREVNNYFVIKKFVENESVLI